MTTFCVERMIDKALARALGNRLHCSAFMMMGFCLCFALAKLYSFVQAYTNRMCILCVVCLHNISRADGLRKCAWDTDRRHIAWNEDASTSGERRTVLWLFCILSVLQRKTVTPNSICVMEFIYRISHPWLCASAYASRAPKSPQHNEERPSRTPLSVVHSMYIEYACMQTHTYQLMPVVELESVTYKRAKRGLTHRLLRICV